ncbi:MAG: DUF1587 domain-containing protein [Deltaproteobacteria bacterium]
MLRRFPAGGPGRLLGDLRSLALSGAGLAGLSGCTGSLDGGAVGTNGAICASPDVPLEAMGRLTRVEYDFTVRDLLHVGGTSAAGFAADDNTIGFEVGGNVSPLLAEQYIDSALALAEAAAEDPGAVDPETSCANGSASTGCPGSPRTRRSCPAGARTCAPRCAPRSRRSWTT